MTQIKETLARKSLMIGLVMFLSLVLVGATSYLAAAKDTETAKTGKGYLGVNIERVSQEDKDEFGVTFGLLVTRVVKGEAAEKAGIKKYDVIQYFNGEKMRRSDDLTEAVRQCKPGSQATVKLVRDGKEKELTVTLGESKFKSFDFDWKTKEGGPFVMKFGGAYLGVYLHQLDKDLAAYFGVKEDGGALILNVSKDTAAEKAGLKPGDIIVKFDGKAIATPKDITKALAKMEKGDKVNIDVIRHNKKETVTAELDEKAGFKDIQIFKSMGKDGHMEVPSIHFFGPDNHERVIIKEKIEKETQDKLKKVEEKVKKVQEKLEDIDEYVNI